MQMIKVTFLPVFFFDNFVTHKYMDVDKHLYYTVYNVKLG